jgi:hypothetical protein
MAQLLWAQLLVMSIPFRRWRSGLGCAVGAADSEADLDAAVHLAADVEWAAKRLPLPTKCLPRAMALSWSLRRRSIRHVMVIAVRPSQLRQSSDAMHAWVEVGGRKILGDLPGPWIETLRLGA